MFIVLQFVLLLNKSRLSIKFDKEDMTHNKEETNALTMSTTCYCYLKITN